MIIIITNDTIIMMVNDLDHLVLFCALYFDVDGTLVDHDSLTFFDQPDHVFIFNLTCSNVIG